MRAKWFFFLVLIVILFGDVSVFAQEKSVKVSFYAQNALHKL